MPKKSRRFKILQSKRKKLRQRPPATIAQQPVVTQIPKPVTSAHPVSTPTPKAPSKIVQYPYVIAEIKTIGILAGITLVILIVLALALP